MASKKDGSLIPDLAWIQNIDEVHIIFKIINPEHILVQIEKDKVYLKCVGGNKEKQLYEVTLHPLLKDIDKYKSGYRIHSNLSVIVILLKIEKLMWHSLTKDNLFPIMMQPDNTILEMQAFENVKLNTELNNLKHQLEEKDVKLKRLKKELNEKVEKINALEECVSDKDKKLQIIEETLNNLFGKTKNKDETNKKDEKVDSKLEELNFKAKDREVLNSKPKANLQTGKEKTDIQKMEKKLSDEKNEEKQDSLIEKQKEKSSKEDINKEEREKSLTSSTKPLVTISGEMKRFIQADTAAVFKIDVNDPSIKIEDVEAKVATPKGDKIPAYVFLGIGKKIYNIKITPTQIGTHEIKVFVKNELALSFTTEVYDIYRIKIDKREYGTVARPCTFKVDVSKAGKGHLSITISHEGGFPIKNEVEKLNDTVYVVKFVPIFRGDYEVKVFYNGTMVKNSWKFTFSIEAFPATSPILAKFPKGHTVQINRKYQFFITRAMLDSFNCNISITIKNPSGKITRCPIAMFDLCSLLGSFVVSEIGVYKINVKINDEHLVNSPHYVRVSYENYEDHSDNLILHVGKPFQFLDVDNEITEYLEKVSVNEKRTFFIDLSGVTNEGIFKLDVLITDPDKQEVPVSITERGSSFMVDFILKIRGDHTLKVIFNGEIVKGTPLVMKAIDDYDLLD